MKITEKTFRHIYESYYEVVCRYLNYYTRDTNIIEEVVQDVFVRLWENRESVEIKFIKTYLYNSARNRMLNYLRDELNRAQLLERWAKTEIEYRKAKDCINRDEFLYLLQTVIDALPLRCKEIFVMSREEKLSYKEIAQKRNISVKTVEAQMGIALKRIRESLISHYALYLKSIALFSSTYWLS
ncbi:DNA-directed RNA polymerase sigma-70 factor [Bacteroidia bacterium]|nr:DNA-directed RNA polymerase sigma-70 factor [Bacteroidia bacterium]